MEAEAWMQTLLRAIDAGYYQPDIDPSGPAPELYHPLVLSARCHDCPFWSSGVCQVRAATRSGMASTCSFIEPANHAEAQAIIARRGLQALVSARWWEWYTSWGWRT